MKDGHRYVVCGKCGRIWNIAKEQDTRYGYLCPECIYKRRMERRKKDGQAHHYAAGGNRSVSSPSGNRSEEIKQLQQDKRDWKNRYYAAAQIKAKGGVSEK